jgi:hypothetical protein
VKVKDDEQKQWALTLLAVSSLFQLVSADKLIRGVAFASTADLAVCSLLFLMLFAASVPFLGPR